MVMIKLDQCGQSSAEILLIVAAALALVLIAGYVAVTVSKPLVGMFQTLSTLQETLHY